MVSHTDFCRGGRSYAAGWCQAYCSSWCRCACPWEGWWGCGSSGNMWEWCGKHHGHGNKAGRGVKSWPGLSWQPAHPGGMWIILNRPTKRIQQSRVKNVAQQPPPLERLWVHISRTCVWVHISRTCVWVHTPPNHQKLHLIVPGQHWFFLCLAWQMFIFKMSGDGDSVVALSQFFPCFAALTAGKLLLISSLGLLSFFTSPPWTMQTHCPCLSTAAFYIFKDYYRVFSSTLLSHPD